MVFLLDQLLKQEEMASEDSVKAFIQEQQV